MDYVKITRQITQAAAASDDGDGFLDFLGPLLVDAGLPLWRFAVSMPALDTRASSVTITWIADAGAEVELTAHGTTDQHSSIEGAIHTLLDQGLTFGRWRLDTLAPDTPYPMLHAFKGKGGTDHVLHLVPLTPRTALRGVALSFTTQAADGFEDEHLAIIANLVPTLGLCMAKLVMEYTFRRTLGTYLGRAAGDQVLEGRILRGEGRTIAAAILLVDLRGFTALADGSDPNHVVSWLDEHLEALGEPVIAAGGEILKFLGDGFLAVFPVSQPDVHPCPDCAKALDAAVKARKANRGLNQRRAIKGMASLEADLVLHFGEVIYGNVGTKQRLDFTIIGRAVNEASRIEKNCEALDRTILISESFAARCPSGLVTVGEVELRGLSRPQRVWTVPDEAEGVGFRNNVEKV